ncbi:MAG: type II toxin-antitoxin system HicA family toxin [Curvibacter sp.]|nr:MAG: type II toxin-antitoxin system HicA family toxin [Curvibacter sp.]
MKAKHLRTLVPGLFATDAGWFKWPDVLALLIAMGATVTQREGSRVAIELFGQIKVMHRPHPSPDMDKAAVASLRQWFEDNGARP